MHYICKLSSPVGMLTAASDGQSVTGLWLEGQKYYAFTLDGAAEEREVPVFGEVKRWLDLYFAGKRPDFCPPLAPKGSEFRQRVWKLLLSIPYGQVTTYGEIARRLESDRGGKKTSARAVGNAVGHNPISILIPCHRVVGADGSLTGYAGGVDKKIQLLKLEGVSLDEKEQIARH